MDTDTTFSFRCHCGCQTLIALQRGVERRVVLSIEPDMAYYDYDAYEFVNDTEQGPTYMCDNTECGREWDSLEAVKAEGLLHQD